MTFWSLLISMASIWSPDSEPAPIEDKPRRAPRKYSKKQINKLVFAAKNTAKFFIKESILKYVLSDD